MYPDLTGTGHDQAVSLNSMLSGGGWLEKMSGGKPVRAVISPLTRSVPALHTAMLSFALCCTGYEVPRCDNTGCSRHKGHMLAKLPWTAC